METLIFTYGDDEEIEPAPGVSEVFLEAKSHPFEQHLHDEHHRIVVVHVTHHQFNHGPVGVVVVHVLHCL